MTSKHPEKLRQLLAYQTLIVRESRRCGGKGWLAYDAMFRQQVAGNDQADWSKLNSSLYAVSFLAQASRARSCTLCMEADHAEEECALAPSKREPRPCFGQASQAQAPRGGSSSRPSKGRDGLAVCFSYNQGTCSFPYGCRFSHSCIKCGRSHPVIHCRVGTPEREGARRPGREWKPASGCDGPRSASKSGL